jgi:hypothetical protein
MVNSEWVMNRLKSVNGRNGRVKSTYQKRACLTFDYQDSELLQIN